MTTLSEDSMFTIKPLTALDQIKEGDSLIMSDGKSITLGKAEFVKVSDYDGVEVIFNLRKNKYFNVGMYLEGKSWVKEVKVVSLKF